MQDYTIRPYIPTDFETVTFLWRRSRQQAFPEFLHAKGHTFEEDQAYFRNVIFVNNEVWVAVINEKVVAFMAISGDFIDQLYVDPDHQRRGIGLTLLEHARCYPPAICGCILSKLISGEDPFMRRMVLRQSNLA